jgi:uncharacterized protein YjbI with pentapeptide repeats
MRTQELRKVSADELQAALGLHRRWLRGQEDGKRADLSGADLSGADLSGADLSGANLSGANLYGADLYGANLSGANLYGANLSGANLYGANRKMDPTTRIETGETWKQYVEEVVPAFLRAGGRTLAEVVGEGWECHSWDNCPTAVAFSCHNLSGVPLLLRPRAEQFIRYFDARLIPNPLVEAVQS